MLRVGAGFAKAAALSASLFTAHKVFHDQVTPKELATEQSFQEELRKTQEDTSTARHIICMTYNMCNNPFEAAFRDPEVYKKYRWKNRLERMMRLIAEEQPHIIGLQEIRDDREVRALPLLADNLGKLGYELVTFRNNSSDGSLTNVIAYQPKHVLLDSVDRYWPSHTPEIESDPWGNGWPRVVLTATFYPTVIKDICGQKVPSRDYAFPALIYANVHNGLGIKNPAEKSNSNRVHIQKMDQLLSRHSAAIGIVVGDFNSFPGRGGEHEMQLFKDAGFTDLIETPKTKAGIPVSGTFAGYAWDSYFSSPEAKRDAFAGSLDHMQCKAVLPRHSLAYFSYINAQRYDNKPTRSIQSEADLLKDVDGQEDRELPSDHVPGIAHLIISPKPSTSVPSKYSKFEHIISSSR